MNSGTAGATGGHTSSSSPWNCWGSSPPSSHLPRFNLVRYHGVLAPGARRRAEVVPSDSGAEDLQLTDVRIAGVHNLDPFALGITQGLSRWPVSLSSTS